MEGYSKGINKNIPKNPLSINKKLAIIKNKANNGMNNYNYTNNANTGGGNSSGDEGNY
jgi:hypothetical protein